MLHVVEGQFRIKLATRNKTNSECGYMNMSMSIIMVIVLWLTARIRKLHIPVSEMGNNENKDDKDENNDNDDNNAKKEMIWDGIGSESCLSLCSKMQTSAQPFEI
ncbi:hypothetical protein HZH68_011758 [Vespula germanica]|uniref:Uncharacterized protein n=1 Tax=Vespula germanica TaxID=30212 RepID=A0A834JJY0_VESGE|nr:hypothetical protein HZH68_011758 [Vespula germanica]